MEMTPSKTFRSHFNSTRSAAEWTRRKFLRSGRCLVGVAANHAVPATAFSQVNDNPIQLRRHNNALSISAMLMLFSNHFAVAPA